MMSYPQNPNKKWFWIGGVIVVIVALNVMMAPQKKTLKNEIVKQKTLPPISELNKRLKEQRPSEKEAVDFSLNTRASIKKLQGALKKAGFDPGPADGKMGPMTKKALARFKASKQLPRNSVMDEETLTALKEYF